MAASSASSKIITLKLLVDKKAQKVLFAEANKEFVDFLFHILSLPVGTVIRLLKKNSMVGSLENLYDSIESLSDTYIQPNQSKDCILNPKIVNYGDYVPLLLSTDEDDDDGDDEEEDDDDVLIANKFYSCDYKHSYVTKDPTALCPQCNKRMKSEMSYVAGVNVAKVTADGGGFVKGVVTYMIMDDLKVKPMSTISSITMLNKFNVKEIGDLEEKMVSLDMKKGLTLLKASFESKNVLTTVFLA